VDTRRGLRIHLSGDPADVVTVFVIFARLDYGRLAPGIVAVDVGANIGVFALFAAASGARRVLAFEPSAESYDLLQRNIEANRLEGVIQPRRVAVTDESGRTVRFPRRSSVMNAIDRSSDANEADEVGTTTLDAILEGEVRVDLLKIDCEGAEYGILLSSAETTYRKVQRLVVELHAGRQDEIVTHLADRGLRLEKRTADNVVGGVFWFDRPAGAA
jgi:FkbM family methyltransferase